MGALAVVASMVRHFARGDKQLAEPQQKVDLERESTSEPQDRRHLGRLAARLAILLLLALSPVALTLSALDLIRPSGEAPAQIDSGGLTSVYIDQPGVALQMRVAFNGTQTGMSGLEQASTDKRDWKFLPGQSRITVIAGPVAPSTHLRLALRLTGNARFDFSRQRDVPPGGTLVSTSAPASDLWCDGCMKEGEVEADLYVIPLVADKTGFARTSVFGDMRVSFESHTDLRSLIELPGYGNSLTINGYDRSRRDPGVPGEWFDAERLNVRVDYGAPLTADSTVWFERDFAPAAETTSFEGENLVTPVLSWGSVTFQHELSNRTFWAGILIGLAGACVVSLIQELMPNARP